MSAITKGRPTSLTPEVADILIARVRVGVPIARAVGAAGIASSTYYQWMDKGRAGEQPYAEFMERVTRAKSELLADLAQSVTSAALDGDVKAAQWILERADREHWSKAADTVVNVNTQQQQPEYVIDASVTVEELEAELEEMT